MLNLKEFVMWGLLVLTGVGLIYAKGHSDATDSLRIEQAIEREASAKKLEVVRNETQRALTDLSLNWKAQLDKSQGAANRTIADLKSRGIGLSVQAADGVVCRTLSGSGPVVNGRVPIRDEDAGFLIGEAKRADLTITALQGVIKTLQGGTNDKTDR